MNNDEIDPGKFDDQIELVANMGNDIIVDNCRVQKIKSIIMKS